MPEYIQIFLAPIRDDLTAQVLTVAIILLIVMDWTFGVANAMFVKHNFSSERMRLGIAHKCTYLGYMMIGVIANAVIFVGIDISFLFQGTVLEEFFKDCTAPIYIGILGYLITMEIGSLLEILVDMNPELANIKFFKFLASVDISKE